jgi:thiol-disulfide isomerase/thioredoxin
MAILIVMALSVAACGQIDPQAGPDSTGLTGPGGEAATSSTEATVVDLEDLGPAPALFGLDGWLQSDIGSLEELRGKVVVVQFWTFGCSNCKATLPNLEALYADHSGDTFEIVGIHSPEFDYEKDPDAISAAAEKLGITWPIALDTRKLNFHGWQGSPAYWPRTYVLDRDGNIRFDHIGEGAYDELDQTVATLLG